MKISEISIPKKLYKDIEKHHPIKRNYDVSFLKKMMNAKGWKKIGEGQFSQVYTKPGKNYIVKVNTQEDEGYQTFVDFCKTYKSPYLPRILDDQFFSADGNKYHIYLIEKLQKMPDDSIASFVDNVLYWEEMKSVEKSYGELEEKFANDPINKKYPGLLKTLFDMYNIGYHHLIDIHPGNVMKRTNGTPVIIDPFS